MINFVEEIFSTPEAVWSSEDGTHIMFATFNDTNVGLMTFPWFSTGAFVATNTISGGGIFPETRSLRYPTPGTPNPDVDLWIIDVTNFTEPIKYLVIPPIVLEGQ